LRKYATFTGRGPRAEYWWFFLFCTLIQVPVMVGVTLASGAHTGIRAGNVVSLAVFLPSLACSVRRLHDRDKSGWWLLIALIPLVGAIILLVWYCTRGTQGVNRFGPENPTST
jgi:uncharacterized membrane protein YhaH (DUF805 family)